MPDHVHLLIRPLQESAGIYYDLARIKKGLKSKSARRINSGRKREGPFWRDEGYDRIMRNHREYQETYAYIAANPVAAGLVETTEDYEWIILARDELRW